MRPRIRLWLASLLALLLSCAASFTFAATVTYGYDDAGRLVTVEYGNATITRTYDPAGNVLAVSTSTPSISGTLQFASAAYSVNENAGSVTVTVTRSGNVAASASVGYSTSANTATAAADFGNTAGTLVWTSGDAFPKTITVPIIDDAMAEPNETFAIVLSNPTGAALGATSSSAVTIVDDDGAATNMPGIATVISNPYGVLSVQGGTLNGSIISNLQTNAVIQLGGTAGGPGSFAQIDFQGLDIGPGNTLTVRSGAPGQTVLLNNVNPTASTIGGILQAQGGNGAAAPGLKLKNPNGITIAAGGYVNALAGLTVDALGATPTAGQNLVNHGVLDGGAQLNLYGAKVTGGGAFKGNAITVATFGNANNPVNGGRFLANGLLLYPSNGNDVALTLNDYGSAPQVFNLLVIGNASVLMPSAWPPGSTLLPNNAPVPPGGSRPPGTPAPAYGGGSMIVQASGSLTLGNGATNDFWFPGGIVFKSGGALNVNGVVVDNGWTTTGQSFQGVFFESPNIISGAGNIQVLSNNLNWVNFSTMPHAPVRTWTLVQMPNGSSEYATADTVAPHLNTYSILNEAAAAGQCWVCLVNTTPVNMQ